MLFWSNRINAPKSEPSSAALARARRSLRSRSKSTRCSQSTPRTAPGEAMVVMICLLSYRRVFAGLNSGLDNNGHGPVSTDQLPGGADDVLAGQPVLLEQVGARLGALGEGVGDPDAAQRHTRPGLGERLGHAGAQAAD